MQVSQEFWSVTAQVIPTPLLTYAVERRFTASGEDGPNPGASLFVSVVVSMAVLGEFLALRGPLGDSGVGSARVVLIAIGTLTLLIFGRFLLGHLVENMPPSEDLTDKHAYRATFLVMTAYPAAYLGTALPLGLAIWLAVTL